MRHLLGSALLVSSLAGIVLLALLTVAASATGPRDEEPRKPAASDAFDEVWQLARAAFFDPEMRGVDWAAARSRHRPRFLEAATDDEKTAAINALLAQLGTSHTRYYSPEEPAYYEVLGIFEGTLDLGELFPEGKVRFTGIGMVTREIEGSLFAEDLVPGAPAETAGILVGDELLAAAGEPFHALRPFAGKAGEKVPVLVRRERGGEPFEIEVVPEEIEPGELFRRSVAASAHLVEAGGITVGVVRIYSYTSASYHGELVALLTAGGELAGADALVLDLRGGWGGASPDYLDLFNQRVPTLTVIPRGAASALWDPKWRKPAVLLVDGATRSGKEVLAHGFQRFRLGPVVGEKTAGAVIAGRPYPLENGGLLYLAVADIRVDGERLEGVGVTPDVAVERPLPYAAGADPQLERALELARAAVRAASRTPG